MAKDALKMLIPDDTADGAGRSHEISPVPVGAFARHQRIVEALLFATATPLSQDELSERLPEGTDVTAVLSSLQDHYSGRGVNLIEVAGKWAFRTSEDLSFLLHREAREQKKLSRAALETLAIIAYHQPATRAEIEEVRGVSTSKGTLDMLMEIGWIRMRGRRRSPGRPVTYGTTDDFLDHFGLLSLADLPGIAELKGAGLLDGNLPADFTVPEPGAFEGDGDDLMDDEDPLGDDLGSRDHLSEFAPDGDGLTGEAD